MKISKIVLHQPAGLLRLLTDTGLEGHCTGISATGTEMERVSSILVHSDPLDRERSWWALKEMDGALPPSLRAGVDIALWDLSAKIAGRPLFRHLGGFRDRVPVCMNGTAGVTPSEIVREAKDAHRAGFKAYRFGALADENTLVHLVREVRAEVGPDFPLILDGQGRCVVDEAIRIGRVLDEADYFYFDRPRPRNDHSGGKQVAGEIDTPTSTDVCSPIEASQVMAAQSGDHIRTSVGGAGGLIDVLKAARCVEAFGAYCHLDGAGICDGFAHLHLAGALRNTPFIEMTGQETASTFVRNPLMVKGGFVHLPELPGLGMDVDLDAAMENTSDLIES